jgi:hypothetical protein
MILECKNKGNNKSITTGKEYEVINETETRYAILNDKGIQANYAKNLFQNAVKEVVIPVIDGLDIETSVTLDNNMLNFKINVKIEGQDDFVLNSGRIMNFNESHISCGIYTLSELNALMTFMTRFQHQFTSYLSSKINIFTVNEDIDFDEIYQEIADSLIQDLIEYATGKFLFLLLSTNINNNQAHNQLIQNSLDKASEAELSGTNPNSNNNIELWVLKCN